MNGYYDRPMSELRALVGDEAHRVKCLSNEANAYREALVRLCCDATSGGRKTVDKAEIADVAGRAIERGNAWHRRGRGEPWERTVGALPLR